MKSLSFEAVAGEHSARDQERAPRAGLEPARTWQAGGARPTPCLGHRKPARSRRATDTLIDILRVLDRELVLAPRELVPVVRSLVRGLPQPNLVRRRGRTGRSTLPAMAMTARRRRSILGGSPRAMSERSGPQPTALARGFSMPPANRRHYASGPSDRAHLRVRGGVRRRSRGRPALSLAFKAASGGLVSGRYVDTRYGCRRSSRTCCRKATFEGKRQLGER